MKFLPITFKIGPKKNYIHVIGQAYSAAWWGECYFFESHFFADFFCPSTSSNHSWYIWCTFFPILSPLCKWMSLQFAQAWKETAFQKWLLQIERCESTKFSERIFFLFFHYKDVKFSKTKFDYFVFTFRKTTHSLIIPYICMLHKHHFSKFNIGNDFALWV